LDHRANFALAFSAMTRAARRHTVPRPKGMVDMDRRDVRSSLVGAGLVGLVSALFAGCGGGARTPSLHVGAPVTVEQPVSIAALAASPETFVGQTVRLEGTVKEVCQGLGCWVEVQDAKGTTFMAKSLDDSVLLPKDCAGRKVVVQGVVTALATEHEEPAEPAGHVCPRPEYVVATQGAMLK
jgi:hypothetical protein